MKRINPQKNCLTIVEKKLEIFLWPPFLQSNPPRCDLYLFLRQVRLGPTRLSKVREWWLVNCMSLDRKVHVEWERGVEFEMGGEEEKITSTSASVGVLTASSSSWQRVVRIYNINSRKYPSSRSYNNRSSVFWGLGWGSRESETCKKLTPTALKTLYYLYINEIQLFSGK